MYVCVCGGGGGGGGGERGKGMRNRKSGRVKWPESGGAY